MALTYKVSVIGHRCELKVATDKDFTVYTKFEWLLMDRDIVSIQDILDHLNSGKPLDKHFFGKVSIWTRPTEWNSTEKEIDIRVNQGSYNEPCLTLKYNEKNIALIKQILTDIRNRKY